MSYQSDESIRYLSVPGNGAVSLSDLIPLLRQNTQPQVIAILDNLQEQHHISYALLWRRRLVKIQVTDWWCRSNRPIEANEPCAKNHGFFFFPIQTVHERISLGRCSEMDGLLDLWIHEIYNDDCVLGSDLESVVYFRDNSVRCSADSVWTSRPPARP